MAFPINVNASGPLPLTIPFSAPMDGDMTLAFSGTCWSNTAGQPAGVLVQLDGNTLGYAALYFNQNAVYMTLPTQFFAVNLSDGSHTITLSAINEYTTSDSNDNFGIWILAA